MSHPRFLVCVSGMSPAVVTETLYALLKTEQQPFVPDEVHVITTLQGRTRLIKELLDPQTGAFHALVREHAGGAAIRFDADTIHVISAQRAASALPVPASPSTRPSTQLRGGTLPQHGSVRVELEDITTEEDNEAAANTIYQVLYDLKSRAPDVQIHASVAGGRKSMSFYMGHAFSLLGGPHDQLSHVLVNEPFENPRLGFYYPPATPRLLSLPDGTSVSTADAQVKLAHLSVLRLNALLRYQDWPERAKSSLRFAVELAQAAVQPPKLTVALLGQGGRSRSKGQGALLVCGQSVALSPVQFTVFALHAVALVHQERMLGGANIDIEALTDTFWDEIATELEDLGHKRFERPTNVKSIYSQIQAKLRSAVGEAVARHFEISPVGKKEPGGKRPYALQVDAALLDIKDIAHWADILKDELS